MSRNYWVLKFIKKREETEEIEKSEAYVNGLANTTYHEAAKDIRSQLNAFRRSQEKILPPDLHLNNITLHINILLKNDPFVHTREQGARINNANVYSDESDRGYSSDSDVFDGEIYYTQQRGNRNTREFNNGGRGRDRQRDSTRNKRGYSNPTDGRQNSRNSKYDVRNKQPSWKQTERKYDKQNVHQLAKKSTQMCEVCGTFGHEKYYECWHLPKHILMSTWMSKNERKCSEVVAKWLEKNHPDNRAKMARKMVRANIVSANKECEYMFTDDIEEELDLCSWPVPRPDL